MIRARNSTPLKSNPFITDRDPKTGRWVVKPSATAQSRPPAAKTRPSR